MSTKQLLLTGSTGFVGRTILFQVLQEKLFDQIVLPVRSIERLEALFQGYGFESIPKNIIPIQSSSLNWKLELFQNCDYVVHAAALLFSVEPDRYFKTNVDGTLRLLENCSNAKRIVILSSQAAGGPTRTELPRVENDLDEPITFYGQSKQEMEMKVQKLFPNLPIVFLRPPMVLGAGDVASLPLFKMAKLWLQAAPGFNKKEYSFIHVSDLSHAVLAALFSDMEVDKLPSRHFYVASKQIITGTQLIAEASKLMNRKSRIIRVPQSIIHGGSLLMDTIPFLRGKIPSLTGDRVREVLEDRWVISPDRFTAFFNCKSETSFEQTLFETWSWYKKTRQL